MIIFGRSSMFRNIYINTKLASEYDIPNGMRVMRARRPKLLTKHDFRDKLAKGRDRLLCDVFYYDTRDLTEILRWLIITTYHSVDGTIEGDSIKFIDTGEFSDDDCKYVSNGEDSEEYVAPVTPVERDFKQILYVMRDYQPEPVLTMVHHLNHPEATKEIHNDFLQLVCPYVHFNGCKILIEECNTGVIIYEKIYVLCAAHNKWFIKRVDEIIKKHKQFLIVSCLYNKYDKWKKFIKTLPARNLGKPPRFSLKPKLEMQMTSELHLNECSNSNEELL